MSHCQRTRHCMFHSNNLGTLNTNNNSRVVREWVSERVRKEENLDKIVRNNWADMRHTAVQWIHSHNYIDHLMNTKNWCSLTHSCKLQSKDQKVEEKKRESIRDEKWLLQKVFSSQLTSTRRAIVSRKAQVTLCASKSSSTWTHSSTGASRSNTSRRAASTS